MLYSTFNTIWQWEQTLKLLCALCTCGASPGHQQRGCFSERQAHCQRLAGPAGQAVVLLRLLFAGRLHWPQARNLVCAVLPRGSGLGHLFCRRDPEALGSSGLQLPEGNENSDCPLLWATLVCCGDWLKLLQKTMCRLVQLKCSNVAVLKEELSRSLVSRTLDLWAARQCQDTSNCTALKGSLFPG